MSLTEYDGVLPIKTTYINPEYRKLYSTELPYKHYFTVLKKYNRQNSQNDFYIALTDDLNKIHSKCFSVSKHNNKVVLVLNEFWNLLPIHTNKEFPVNVELIEEEDGVIIYYIDI